MAYSEQAKQDAATELMNAEQNIKELGALARKSDIKRLEKARIDFKRITERNP